MELNLGLFNMFCSSSVLAFHLLKSPNAKDSLKSFKRLLTFAVCLFLTKSLIGTA